jgi:hypothetical protein
MKTMKIFRNIAFMIMLSLITTAGFAQETIYQNRRGNETKRGSEVTQRNYEKNAQPKSKNDYKQNDYNTNKKSDYKNQEARNDNYQYKNKNNGQSKGNGENYERNYHHQSGHNHSQPVHVNDNRIYHKVYHRHFNNHRVNKFYHRGMDYYHVDNCFYRYDPWHGYYLVDAPYAFVMDLPGSYFVRNYNGTNYIFAHGFLYLPFQDGFLLVPQPERPGISLNIVLN